MRGKPRPGIRGIPKPGVREIPTLTLFKIDSPIDSPIAIHIQNFKLQLKFLPNDNRKSDLPCSVLELIAIILYAHESENPIGNR